MPSPAPRISGSFGPPLGQRPKKRRRKPRAGFLSVVLELGGWASAEKHVWVAQGKSKVGVVSWSRRRPIHEFSEREGGRFWLG